MLIFDESKGKGIEWHQLHINYIHILGPNVMVLTTEFHTYSHPSVLPAQNLCWQDMHRAYKPKFNVNLQNKLAVITHFSSSISANLITKCKTIVAQPSFILNETCLVRDVV